MIIFSELVVLQQSDSMGHLMQHNINKPHKPTSILRAQGQRKGLLFWILLLFFSSLFYSKTAKTGLCIWFYPGWGELTPVRDREWEEAGLKYHICASAPSKGERKANSPNRGQTLRQACSALGWLSSHTHAISGGGVKFGLVLWKP